MNPGGADYMDAFIDADDRYHMVVFSHPSTLYYTFREFGTWYYIEIESTEQEDVTRIVNPVMKMDDNGVIHVVYVRNAKLAYVQIDEDRNVIHKPGMDKFVYGLSLALDSNGLPNIAYVNRNHINPDTHLSNLFHHAAFDGEEWHYEAIYEVAERHWRDIPRTKVFFGGDGELNVLFFRDIFKRMLLTTRDEGEWVVRDSLELGYAFNDNMYSFDFVTNQDGSVHGCYIYNDRVWYLTAEQGLISSEQVDFSSSRRHCTFTADEEDNPVIFGFNFQQGTSIAKRSGEQWEISLLSSSRHNHPLKIDVDSEGHINLLMQVWDQYHLIFTKGEQLQDGVFTGLQPLMQNEGWFRDFYTVEDKLYALYTEFEPETFVIDNQITVKYFPVSDIQYISGETSSFDRTEIPREAGNDNQIISALYHNGKHVKLEIVNRNPQNVAGTLFYYYDIGVFISDDGLVWAKTHTFNEFIDSNPKLFQADGKLWVVDKSGYSVSDDGMQWTDKSPMPPEIFQPYDFINITSSFELDGKVILTVHNRGESRFNDKSCIMCHTERMGQFMLFYDDEHVWSYTRLTNMNVRGFVLDGDELVNFTAGTTFRSTDAVNWAAEPNTLERNPGQVVKTDQFFFASDPQLTWENMSNKLGFFNLSRDGINWQRVPFNNKHVNDAIYRMHAIGNRLFVAWTGFYGGSLNDFGGTLYEWGEGQEWGADDARIVPYLSVGSGPPEDLVFSGRWSSHQGHDIIPSTFRMWRGMAVSHYPDLYGVFIISQARSGTSYINAISYWNGLEWETIPTPTSRTPTHLHIYNDGQRTHLIAVIPVGTYLNRILMAWNGEGWTDITDSEFDISIFAVTTFTSSEKSYLVVAGVGNPTANNFMGLWDGENWTYFSGQSYDNLLPVGAMTTMNIDGKEYLFVGGNITSIGNTEAIRYARFDGEQWEPIEGVTNEEPLQMVTLQNEDGDDYVVITGRFTEAGPDAELDVNGMVAFDGAEWHKLSSELDGEHIRTLESLQTQSGSILFAGGNPGMDGQGGLNNIGVLYDGEWRGLDNGVDGSVRDLAILNDGSGPVLYAYGDFKRAGSVTALGLARIPLYFTGRSISNLLEQVDEGENQILAFPQMNLTLAGNVINAGWMNVEQREQQINPDELPDNFIGAGNIIWEFNMNTVTMSDVYLSAFVDETDSIVEGETGKRLMELVSDSNNELAWLMDGGEGWVDLGGVISNGQLVSQQPTNVLKRAAIGLLSATAVSNEGESEVPLEFSLSQNYPNPFNPTTTIRFTLPEPAGVRLDLFDILGRRVGTLVNDRLSADAHTFTFDGSGLASGLYFYRLHAGDRVAVRKMMLVK